MNRTLVVVAVLVPVAAGCSSTMSSTASRTAVPKGSTQVAPAGRAFYAGPTTKAKGTPGTLIWSQAIAAPAGAHAWRILYKSRSVAGKDIVVSGVLVAPDGSAPAGGRPVVTWAHGTTGTADVCAPSKARNVATKLPDIAEFMKDGYVVVATDYEGLGTPGLHPYLFGKSEGRGVLDAARAARMLPEAHASANVAIYGYSQGGHAALFAGQIAPSYAPDLHIVGDVAGAPVGDLKLLLPVATSIPAYRGLAVMGGFGFAAADPRADPRPLLTPAAYALGRAKVEHVCSDGVVKAFADPNMKVFTQNPLDVAPWPELLTTNTPGNVKIAFPVVALQGLADELVPPSITESWRKRACALGTTVEVKTYAGQDHGGGYTASLGDAAHWIADRFAGKPAVDGCSKAT
jgi:Dipeptidyl aminopeptidases/acylaminoacyl-peptidases